MRIIERIKALWGRPRMCPVYCWYNARLQKYLVCQFIRQKWKYGCLMDGVVVFNWQGDKTITADEFQTMRSKASLHYFFPPRPRILEYCFEAPPFRRYSSAKCRNTFWYEFEMLAAGGYRGFRHEEFIKVQAENIDLCGKQFVTIRNSQLEVVKIDCNLNNLSLCLSSVRRVVDQDCGRRLYLHMRQSQYFPDGLKKRTRLLIQDLYRIDLEEIAAKYPELTSLVIDNDQITCTMLNNLSALKRLPKLEYLRLQKVFGFNASEIPGPEDLPRLYWIELEGYPAETKEMLEKLWRSVEGVTLNLSKDRTKEWLEENRYNPFWDWEDRDWIPLEKVQTANLIYQEVDARIQQLEQLPPEEVTPEFLSIIREFIHRLNQLNGKGAEQFIDDEDREMIYSAIDKFLNLARNRSGLKITEDCVKQLFDSEREW